MTELSTETQRLLQGARAAIQSNVLELKKRQLSFDRLLVQHGERAILEGHPYGLVNRWTAEVRNPPRRPMPEDIAPVIAKYLKETAGGSGDAQIDQSNPQLNQIYEILKAERDAQAPAMSAAK